ncbi:hypothetical protein RJT34_13499 [Clitoria ternatea]|uniref:Reverse transcriptase zinc-binding domain-containing protein n=1 Tax=Clitoria ternatea TaxID=43366 RepID=A0AAN9JP21_CLITE
MLLNYSGSGETSKLGWSEQVLNSKYDAPGHSQDVIQVRSARVWTLLKDLEFWSLGNSTSIDCWHDAWISQNLKFTDMVPSIFDETWNNKLPILFLPLIGIRSSLTIPFLLISALFRWSASSDLCGHPEESIIHVLRNCHHATILWSQLIAPNNKMIFFSGDSYQWIISNLLNSFGSYEEYDWQHIWECHFLTVESEE